MRTPEETIRRLHPKIKKSLYYTKLQDREDLEQELKTKIVECIHRDNFEDVPGFWMSSKQFEESHAFDQTHKKYEEVSKN